MSNQAFYLLTSSRADFSIYLPLISLWPKKIKEQLRIVAFGSHLLHEHGDTVNSILQEGFEVYEKISIANETEDSDASVARKISATTMAFASFWDKEKNQAKAILALGDRYEMFAAVVASIPFRLPIIHFHGGETSEGSIDDLFRDCISRCSYLHFTATEQASRRLEQLMPIASHLIENVGALALDHVNSLALWSSEEWNKHHSFSIDLPFALFTMHPETAHPETNASLAEEVVNALSELAKRGARILITLPNADNRQVEIRSRLLKFSAQWSNQVYAVDSLGPLGYYTALKHCQLVMGNSSSGIIEAASFQKWVINIGNRQKGRLHGMNVKHVEAESSAIVDLFFDICNKPFPEMKNPYGSGDTAPKVIASIQKHFLS